MDYHAFETISDMSAKEDALKHIAAIAREQDLTSAEVLAALSNTEDSSEEKTSVLTKLLGYFGGIFVLAGLGVFIEMQWSEMNSFSRIVITLGSGIAAFVMAYFAVNDERWEKTATPLFLVAALLQPMGILVAIDEFSRGGDERHAILFASGVLLVQQTLAFIKLRRTVLVFAALVFAVCFYGTSMDLMDVDEDLIVFSIGLSLLCVTYSIDRTPHAAITPFWYFASSTATLVALFSLIEETFLEILFLGAGCGLVFLSTWVKSRSLLAVGTVAILGYVGYFTAEHFTNVVGWPVALIMFGMMLIGLSAAAFRINRKYIAPG